MAAPEPIRVLTVVGSLRDTSLNRRLARLAPRLGATHEPLTHVEFVEFDALGTIEPYDEDVEADGFPTGAARFAAALRSADAVLIATPEYNGSIPGQLKNALDWVSRPESGARDGGLQASAMYGMPVSAVSVSSGQFGGVWARDELIKVLRTQGARVVAEPALAIPNGKDAFDEAGFLRSEQSTTQLIAVLEALVTQATTVRTAIGAARLVANPA